MGCRGAMYVILEPRMRGCEYFGMFRPACGGGRGRKKELERYFRVFGFVSRILGGSLPTTLIYLASPRLHPPASGSERARTDERELRP